MASLRFGCKGVSDRYCVQAVSCHHDAFVDNRVLAVAPVAVAVAEVGEDREDAAVVLTVGGQ